MHQSISQSISTKTWFGFDLDDTLHEFRKASSTASASVFDTIHQQFNIPTDKLRETYTHILRSATANSFTDGRSSVEYRTERFSRLLQSHGLDAPSELLDALLEIYQNSLQQTLTLKTGALNLLQAIKHRRGKVIIITEGPSDSQEWTVRELGLRPYVDALVTTNEFGLSKIDGLFPAVLAKHGIPAQDMLYIGDNEHRDILPAREAGILAVYYDETRECSLLDLDSLRINSLAQLAELV